MGSCEFKLNKGCQDQMYFLKNFYLVSVVGQGGFGKVYKAQIHKTKQTVALKVMSKVRVIQKKSVHSVMNELQILCSLKNDFIINIVCAFQDKQNLYLAMDFMAGGDLRYHLCKYRKFNEKITKHIAICIILGLEYIHQNGIIHRDIKPENLVFDNKGYLRITDFGIARIWKPNNSHETSGTPGYMAPEVMCRQNHGVAVDYFALGVIIYECISGKRPYNGKNRQEIREQMISKQASMTEIPAGWTSEAIHFVNSLLHRKPTQRLGVNGPDDVRDHPWFNDADWSLYSNKMVNPPFVPNENAENYIKSNRLDTLEDQSILQNEQVQLQFMGYEYGENLQTAPAMKSFIQITKNTNQSINMILLLLFFQSTSCLDITNKCTCQMLVQENDCLQKSDCYWLNGHCNSFQTCSNDNIDNCAEIKGCAIVEGQCIQTTCDKLLGNTLRDCQDQSVYCTYYEGEYCSTIKYAKCEDFSEEECEFGSGSIEDGHCIWNNNQCMKLTQCSQSHSDPLKCVQIGCKYSNSQCVEKECKQWIEEKDCKYILSVNSNNVEICHWNGETCIISDQTSLNEDNCLQVTQQAYYWDGAACSKCEQQNNYSGILQIIILIILSLI